MSETGSRKSKGRKARGVRQQAIGENLRKLYGSVLEEDVPDDFLRLLEEADNNAPASESGGKRSEGTGSAKGASAGSDGSSQGGASRA